jgi:hypothetical protein
MRILAGRCAYATLAAVGVLAAACGPSVSLRVEQRSLQQLPLESRLDLLDAENDLFAAVDRRDDAEQGVDDARIAVRRANDRIGQEEHDLDKAEDTHDKQGVVVGKLAVEEAKARRNFLETQVDVARAHLRVEEARLLAAEGRFERAKADVAKKAKTPGSADLKLKDFDDQVKALEAHVKDVQKDYDSEVKDSEKSRQKWLTLSRQLSQLTGGAQGSAWVE